MKDRNLIILIVGIILVGLFLITEIPNFNMNLDNQQENPQDNNYSSQNNEINQPNQNQPNQINNYQEQSNDKKIDNPSSSKGNNT